jgi:hypothetical protein
MANFTGIQKKKTRKQKETKPLILSNYLQLKEAVNNVCLTCSGSEKIPLSVVRDFDRRDEGGSGSAATLPVKLVEERYTRNTIKGCPWL